jgi:hypothetical protein
MSNLANVQRRLGVPASSHWDAMTTGALRAFQSGSHGVFPMQPTGHVDPPTLANLGYYDPLDEMTPASQAYLSGTGEKPGTFWRDLAATTNQVPQWAWLTLGAGMIGLGWWGWHQSAKKKG